MCLPQGKAYVIVAIVRLNKYSDISIWCVPVTLGKESQSVELSGNNCSDDAGEKKLVLSQMYLMGEIMDAVKNGKVPDIIKQ